MSEKDTKSSHDPSKSSGFKKDYAKPSISSEPIYETLALACAKLPGQGALCNSSPRRS